MFLAASFFAQAQKTVHLDTKSFKKQVYNYEKNKNWKYEGKKAAVVDFYATWCGPCKYIAPFLEELAQEYGDKIVIYKVNVSENRTIARAMKVSSIPMLLFVKPDGNYKKIVGGRPKADLEKEINNYLNIRK